MKLILTFLLTINCAFGEYRVYQYFVKNNSTLDPQAYLQLSSLDPVSFRAYHGGAASIKVDLLRSWLCRGHTGGLKNYCNSPLKLKDTPIESIRK